VLTPCPLLTTSSGVGGEIFSGGEITNAKIISTTVAPRAPPTITRLAIH